MNSHAPLAASLTLLLIGFILIFDGYSAAAGVGGGTSTVTSTTTITSTSVADGTVTVTTTTGSNGQTTTFTTTVGGSTTTETTTLTTTVGSCPTGQYYYAGPAGYGCYPLPSAATTTTTVSTIVTSTTVNNVVTTFTTTKTLTIATTTTVTAPALGIPTNCNYNGYALICSPLTVTVLVYVRGGYTMPVVNDSVQAQGTLYCGSAAVGVKQSSSTNLAGQAVLSIPAYYPTTIGVAAGNVPCTGSLTVSEGQNHVSTDFTQWPSVNQVQLNYVVYLSILGGASPTGSIGPTGTIALGAIITAFGFAVAILSQRKEGQS